MKLEFLFLLTSHFYHLILVILVESDLIISFHQIVIESKPDWKLLKFQGIPMMVCTPLIRKKIQSSAKNGSFLCVEEIFPSRFEFSSDFLVYDSIDQFVFIYTKPNRKNEKL
ncbi:hypothetical protein DERP_009136 [Dermatophagoides pteronyssinus]|uniref:Uncharacterized protein n=1 Tax=Dermatophagoides pteronyssinus TaxID=6956 RepID=A0ABQ8JQM6_DERPT|nr:hypothetical protein DERP_009136 [Dermatophagoides pteronyssinus]